MNEIIVSGVVVRGHGVASGTSPASPYPAGTIALQLPHFLERGLDLRDCFPATINVDIAPRTFTIRRARHTLPDVAWTELHGPETFSFLRCRLEDEYEGWVYYPHPETKPVLDGKRVHEQPRSVLELLMPHIPGLGYGDGVTLTLDPREITISQRR